MLSPLLARTEVKRDGLCGASRGPGLLSASQREMHAKKINVVETPPPPPPMVHPENEQHFVKGNDSDGHMQRA